MTSSMESLSRLMRRAQRRLVICALLIFTLTPTSPLAGREIEADAYHQEWRWVRFDEQSGLPSEHILDIVESTAGTQWVLTSNGLAWYDKYQWQSVALPQAAAIEPPAQIVADSNNRIVVTTGGSVYRGDQHGMVRLPTETSAGNVQVTSAAPIDGDRVLLRSADRAILLWDNGKTTRLAISDKLQDVAGHNRTLRRLRDGSVWLATSFGTFRWSGSDLELQFRRPAPFLRIDDSGTILVGSCVVSPDSIWTWPDKSSVPVPEEVLGWQVSAMDVAPNGDAIVVYRTGELWIRDAGVWKWLTPLPWALVDARFVAFQRNGDLWAATNHGLFLCRRSLSRWEHIDFDRSHINALLRGTNGDLWIAHTRGLTVQHPDGTEETTPSIGDVPLHVVTGLAEDADGNIWISSGGAFTGVFRLRNGHWRHYGPSDGLPEARFHKIAKDSRGRLWFLGHAPAMPATKDRPDPGAYVYDNGKFVRWSVPEGLLHGRVYAFAESNDGSYWFGTLGGLSRWKDNHWTHWRQQEGLRASKIFTLAVGPDGRVWFGHQHRVGLGYIDEQDHPVYVIPTEPLGHAGVWNLQFASNGVLWIATDRGLGRLHEGRSSLFDSSVGARGLYIWPILPEEHKVYAGTQGDGLHTLDLSEASNPPPRVTIRPAVFSGSNTIIQWNVHPFQAEQPCSTVSTRFRLDSGAWSPWSRTHAATIATLQHGDHTLTVQAKSLFGKVDAQGTRLTFGNTPPLLHARTTSIAFTAAAIIVIAVIALYYRERRRQMVLVRASEEKYRGIFDDSVTAVYVLDREKKFLDSNRAGLKLLGYSKQELLAMSVSDVDQDPDLVRPVHKQLLAGEPIVNYEHRLTRKDGAIITVLNNSRPLTDRYGKVVGMQSTVIDISERKRAVEKLRLSEVKYRTLFDQAYAAILVFDPDDETILEANRQACAIYGFSHDEMIGRTLDLIQPPERRGRDKTMEILNDTSPQGVELEHFRKDRTPVFVEARASMVEYEGREAVLTINRDITARKHAEDEHKKLEEQLRHAYKMKAIGQLAAGVAHEFNNLLVAILGNTEFLLSKVNEAHAPTFKEPLEDINTCGQRAAALTQQLLGFARKRTSHIQSVDLNAVVEGADRLLQRILGEHITLHTDLDSDLWPVDADVTEMEQAVMNLAINARDAMPDGGTLTIRTKNVNLDDAHARANPDARVGPHSELIVADDGCGMTQETIRRIFEPFFTTKPLGEGTGLGLSTVFADVAKLGGHVTVDSQLRVGTTIRIRIPTHATTEAASAPNIPQPATAHPIGHETILVCDDSEQVLKSISLLLETAGYTVLRARGGHEALQLASSHVGTIHLLLTDVIMPKMNGPQLADALIEQRPSIRVLYMSGYPSDVFKAGVVEGQHVEFLQKPLASGVLIRSVHEVLDQQTKANVAPHSSQ